MKVHTHTIMRQPSPLQHMLGCLAEATLTACLTAASVCYEHGPVSTPLSSPSLRPPPLCLSFSSRPHHSLRAYLALVLPLFLISSSCRVKRDRFGLVITEPLCMHLLIIFSILILSLNFVFSCSLSYSTSLSTSSLPGSPLHHIFASLLAVGSSMLC